jgi:dolichol-phosphate mannosyltransferase
MMSEARTLVMIPTYNESENVEVIASGVLASATDADLLFVDDGSPDGTGAILDRLARACPRLQVLHRAGKLGIGSAHKAGIRWAYEHGYTRLVTMDSDLSHSPSDIPRLLAASNDADVVVGSRFAEANSLEGWAWTRKLLTHLGHRLTTIFLQLPQDCTNAFRVYRLDRIPADFFETVQSTSYSFFLESLHRLNISGFCISQVAIKLPPRTYGHSKMRLKDIAYSVRVILQLAWRTRSNRASMVYAAPRSGRDVTEQAQADRVVTPPRCARQ